MRKTSLLLLVLASLICPVAAMADWSVTVTWTPSVGPDLASEQCLLDGAAQPLTSANVSVFQVPTLSGQAIVIRSTNSQGAYSETTPITLSAAPAPATGVMATITYVSP